MSKIKVEITRNTVAGGKVVRIGDVVDLEDKDAKFLIHLGKAKIYTAPAKPERTKANNGFDPKKPNPQPPLSNATATEGEEWVLADKTIDQIKAFALEMGIELPATANKAKMIEIIEAELAGIDEEGEPAGE